MDFFGKKKDDHRNGSVQFEPFGTTEPVPGGMPRGTENIVGMVRDGDLSGGVGRTEAAGVGGTVGDTIPPIIIPEPIIDKHTMPVIIPTPNPDVQPVVGWLVCIKGSNYGKEYRIHSQNNYVGREKGDIIIQGDPQISAQNHMCITFEPKHRNFFLSNGTATNSIYYNDDTMPVLSPLKLNSYDVISTGETTLMFIGFCGEKFSWSPMDNEK